MNNLKKVGLSALAGSMVLTSAQAFEPSINVESQVVYSSAQGDENASEASNGKGIGVDNDIAFSGSGELDNGFTVSVTHILNTNEAVTNSSSQLAVGMGSLGSIQINNQGGAATNAIDDILPFAYEEPWDGTVGTSEFHVFGSQINNGSITYRAPAIDMMGVTANIAVDYDPQANVAAPAAGGVGTDGASGEGVTLTLAHESGLTFGGGYTKPIDGPERTEQNIGRPSLRRASTFLPDVAEATTYPCTFPHITSDQPHRGGLLPPPALRCSHKPCPQASNFDGLRRCIQHTAVR